MSSDWPLDLLSYVGYSISHCGTSASTLGGKQTDASQAIAAKMARVTLLEFGPSYLAQRLIKSWLIVVGAGRDITYAIAFKPDKKHRQALNKMNKFVLGPEYVTRDCMDNGKFNLDSALHASEYNLLDPGSRNPKHRFATSFTATVFTEEKMALYRKYQVSIHGDTPSKLTNSGFKRFLCDSPIAGHHNTSKPSISLEDGTKMTWGSCHQLYRLDGKLIAMGVLDILPNCVSSVYFIYDPEYAHLSLGRVSACREASLAKSLYSADTQAEIDHNVDPDRANGGWYYMGFFIPSCQKMKYKGDYSPSFLLDPCSTLVKPTWRPLQEFKSQWCNAGGNSSEDHDWFVSIVNPETTAESEEFDTAGEDESSPSVLSLSGMPGREDVALTTMSRVSIYIGENKTRFLDDVLARIFPDLRPQVAAMLSILGQDRVDRTIFVTNG